MTACKKYLKELIEKEDHISIGTFMELTLYHPEFGYYMKQNPLGDRADFVTSPEISQMFAEIICIWAMEKYLDLQKPSRLAVIELGPGRGLLMSDFLKFAQRFPDFYASLEIHLIEISPTLKTLQQTQLNHPYQFWHTCVEEAFEKINHLPTLILANEFFDALPINQYRRQDHTWQQRYITLNTKKEFKFCFKNIPQEELPFEIDFDFEQNNQIIEHSSKTEDIIRKLVEHLKSVSGAALITDYGYLKGQGDSLQGVSQHKYQNILENLGEIDLTTHVNFGNIQKIVGKTDKVMTQRDFLFKYGLLELAQKYGQNANSLVRHQIEQQVYKLTSSQEMGTLFKVLDINFLANKDKENA